LERLAENLRLRGRFLLEEAFIDGTFAPAKRGGAGVGKTKRGKHRRAELLLLPLVALLFFTDSLLFWTRIFRPALMYQAGVFGADTDVPL
jgi:hypothetical protein